jgi:hypothetical protein
LLGGPEKKALCLVNMCSLLWINDIGLQICTSPVTFLGFWPYIVTYILNIFKGKVQKTWRKEGAGKKSKTKYCRKTRDCRLFVYQHTKNGNDNKRKHFWKIYNLKINVH